jgi:hypothetical protein
VDAAALDRFLGATRKRVFFLHDVHRSGPCLLHSRWALSYLRGPLTREEISRLMKGRQPSPAQAAATAAAAVAGPPVLPAPFRHNYLAKYGGELADAHLFVKYAVRYKDSGERVAVQAYPLGGATAAELLEAEPIEIEEAAVRSDAPASVRYAELPDWLAAAGGKGVERALRERLPDKLAVTLFVDPVSKTTSQPGEDREAFAARLQQAGAGPKQGRLRDQIEKKKRDLAAREQDLAGRKTEKWAALGTAVLSNIGILMGRKRSISGAGTVLSKNRMENTAEARVEALRAELADLEGEPPSVTAVDPGRFEEKTVLPARTEVKVLRYDVLWVY